MGSQAPFYLPPVLPDVESILKEYLICPDRLPIHEYEKNQEFWPREPDITELFNFDKICPCGTTLKVQRDHNTGKIVEFRECSINEVGLNPKNSMSLNRAPAPASDSVRGDPTHFPFWPGGFPLPDINIAEEQFADFSELLTIPPGFKRGLCFEEDGFTVLTEKETEAVEEKAQKVQVEEPDNTVNLMNLIQQEQDFLGLWKDNRPSRSFEPDPSGEKPTLEIDEAEVLPSEPEIPVLNISKAFSKPVIVDTEWAVMVDVQQSVTDFEDRIPEMAHKYDFNLDSFQKQAILKLEEKCDVFVAAHTSAGKTVVAEYAIALSQKHNTRTIYTSPIKALSNQKYRDFKMTFQDVGLVTGDFQINQTGVCLVMTTEILRSMLYGGSEIIRDLEYVIFDEVHYINDAERGHVWEEVLIMLPDHVRIVLLSATVPNPIEFATWLGMTKRRKVYVISTLTRPVPLQHYLYTGSGGKSKDDRFLLLDAKGNFLLQGHKQATEALQSHKKLGVKGRAKDDKGTGLTALVYHLQRNELLPVVIFTFSRQKCDTMAWNLKSIDLTTAKEKSRIKAFFRKCVNRLKKPDQELPQILQMQQVLENGIGVHHSGILPIIKEIIEMLFQDGLVKVLFATETFAMGVNMPAKTVVFNSTEKYDGVEKRRLRPGEYIQMAGRAGRRGKDTVGTVIIRCTDAVPDVFTLKEMMLGKPQQLESQFRLTYSMLLNLFRVESLSVESMMTRSFGEVKHVTKAEELKVELERTRNELANCMAFELGEHLQQLVKFYHVASEYIKQWKIVQPKLMLQPRVVKELTPGKVLLISHKTHYKKLALLLCVKKHNQGYRILVLANQKISQDEIELSVHHSLAADPKSPPEKKPEHPDIWYRMLSFTHEEVFQPSGVGGHEVLDVVSTDVLAISTRSLKIDCEALLRDWDNRQIPRFRDNPPGQSCQQAIQELAKITNSVLSGCKVEYLDPKVDYKVADLNVSQGLETLCRKEEELRKVIGKTRIANFEHQFENVFRRKYLEEKMEEIKFRISTRSLSLYPEYQSRIELLKHLRYIDEENTIDMKGKVACEMGMNELLITELVFRNTFTNLQPAEVAALLSPLVFQVKPKEDQGFPKLTETLNDGMKKINDLYLELKSLESTYQITSPEDDLNFGLVEIVYEWARDKPFAEIMKLTDVHEGIIVRCIQQLNEILKDVRDAARIIGDPVLQTKMEEASTAIKRDIVFAASLYTNDDPTVITV